MTIILLTYLFVLQEIVSLLSDGVSTTGQDNWEQTLNKDVDVLFIGNSRCICTIVPSKFSKITGYKSINLGANGQDNFEFFKTRISRFLLNGNESPKYVIIVSEPINSISRQKEQKDRFARYAFNPNLKNLPLIDYFEFDNLDRYIPAIAVLRHRSIFNCIFQNNKSTFELLGYDKKFGNICNSELIQFDKSLVDRNNNTYSKQLESFHNWLRKKNIKLICVQLPMLGMKENEKSILNNSKLILKQKIPFINLYLDCLNSCDLFADRYHPNGLGAKLITVKLAEEFNKIK